MPKARSVVAKKSRTAAARKKQPVAHGAAAPGTRDKSVAKYDSSLLEVTRELRTLADKMLESAAAAARGLRAVAGGQDDEKPSTVGKVLTGARAIGAAASSLRSLGSHASPPGSWGKAGEKMRELREQAGMSLNEVGKAVDLKDPELLAAAEQGRATLPFEMILRLSAVLGRKDPLTALMTLTRTSYPHVWESLESMGIGKLVLQSARERAFVNVLVADDRVRRLNDSQFSELLAFVKSAMQLALAFNERVGESMEPAHD